MMGGQAVSVEILDGERMWTRRSCIAKRQITTHEPYVSKFFAVGVEVGLQSLRYLQESEIYTLGLGNK